MEGNAGTGSRDGPQAGLKRPIVHVRVVPEPTVSRAEEEPRPGARKARGSREGGDGRTGLSSMVRLLVDVDPKRRKRRALALAWPWVFRAIEGADVEVAGRPRRACLSDAAAMADVGLGVNEMPRRRNPGDGEQPKDKNQGAPRLASHVWWASAKVSTARRARHRRQRPVAGAMTGRTRVPGRGPVVRVVSAGVVGPCDKS